MSELPGLFKIWASYKPTAEIETFIGDKGQLFYSEEEKILRISDGVTPGGIPISSANLGSGDGIAGLTSDEINKILKLNSGWNFVPETNELQDLGAADKRWRHIYVSGGTIFLGDNATISENPANGSIVLPEGATMRNSNGELDPVATVDIDSINWNLVLAGRDLGLAYATVPYVDGKIREAVIKGVMAENGISASQLADLDDIGVLNLLDGSFLQYNAAGGKWQANTTLAGEIVTLLSDVTVLETNYNTLETTVNNITNNITNINDSITNINNSITNVTNNITEITQKVDTLPIENLSNVDADSPESGSLLQYNGSAGRWQATNNIETTFGTLRLNGGAF